MSAQKCVRCAKVATRLPRGLCKGCYNRARYRGTLGDYERKTRTVAETIEELTHLGLDERLPIAPQLRALAPQLGMTYRGVERAWNRHRKQQAA